MAANGSSLTVKSDGNLENLVGVKVDGEWIGEDKRDLASGSTIVTLKADYLATLNPGVHVLTLVYNDGEVSTNFTIIANSPDTGIMTTEGNSAVATTISAAISFIAFSTAGLLIIKRIH